MNNKLRSVLVTWPVTSQHWKWQKCIFRKNIYQYPNFCFLAFNAMRDSTCTQTPYFLKIVYSSLNIYILFGTQAVRNGSHHCASNHVDCFFNNKIISSQWAKTHLWAKSRDQWRHRPQSCTIIISLRLISRQRGGLAALKLTKIFGIDHFQAAKDSGKVLIIIIYCYLLLLLLLLLLIHVLDEGGSTKGNNLGHVVSQPMKRRKKIH